MKSIITLLIFSIISFSVNAQSDSTAFVPGYFILEPGAQYQTLAISSADASIGLKVKDAEMAAGEIVFLTSKISTDYMAFDPSGRMMIIRGNVTRAKQSMTSGVGLLQADIQLVSGDQLTGGSYLWITGQDLGNNTVTVQMHSGQEFSIPSNKVVFLNTKYRTQAKGGSFKTVL